MKPSQVLCPLLQGGGQPWATLPPASPRSRPLIIGVGRDLSKSYLTIGMGGNWGPGSCSKSPRVSGKEWHREGRGLRSQKDEPWALCCDLGWHLPSPHRKHMQSDRSWAWCRQKVPPLLVITPLLVTVLKRRSPDFVWGGLSVPGESFSLPWWVAQQKSCSGSPLALSCGLELNGGDQVTGRQGSSRWENAACALQYCHFCAQLGSRKTPAVWMNDGRFACWLLRT